MKKFYALTCSMLLSTLSFIALGQTDPDEKRYHHDVGFNTTFLLNGIFNSGGTPFALMYKHYKDDNNPLRLGVRLTTNLSKTTENSQSNYNNQSSLYFSAVIGKEFQKEINQHWIWYFGGDIIPSYQYSNIEYYYTNGYNQTTSDKSAGLGFMPFLGIRYNINNRLYLSTEFSFGPTYRYSWNSIEENPGTIIRDTETSTFNFSMNPAYGLFLYYRF